MKSTKKESKFATKFRYSDPKNSIFDTSKIELKVEQKLKLTQKESKFATEFRYYYPKIQFLTL